MNETKIKIKHGSDDYYELIAIPLRLSRLLSNCVFAALVVNLTLFADRFPVSYWGVVTLLLCCWLSSVIASNIKDHAFFMLLVRRIHHFGGVPEDCVVKDEPEQPEEKKEPEKTE